jgi:hypothetical protein
VTHIPVCVGCVKQRDAEVERLMHQPDRFAFSKISPPAGGNCPQTKTNLAHGQVSIFVSPETHETYLTTENAEVTERIHYRLGVFCDSVVKLFQFISTPLARSLSWPTAGAKSLNSRYAIVGRLPIPRQPPNAQVSINTHSIWLDPFLLTIRGKAARLDNRGLAHRSVDLRRGAQSGQRHPWLLRRSRCARCGCRRNRGQ